MSMVKSKLSTVEPRFNEVTGDRPKSFVKWRVCFIEVSVLYILLSLGQRIPFVILMFSLNRGSLNRGSTVITLAITKDTDNAVNQSQLEAFITCSCREARENLRN